MRCAILTIGTEILFGQIVNTNTVYLTRELNNMGFDVLYHHTVGDNANRLKDLIHETYRDCDLIVCTGGLGPTEDDLTKETIAEAFSDKLEMHEESLAEIEAFAKRRGWKEITPNNYKQAMMPTRATVFQNDVGTAPAFALAGVMGGGTVTSDKVDSHSLSTLVDAEDNTPRCSILNAVSLDEFDGDPSNIPSEGRKIIVTMPGPPREMKWMWNNRIKPYLLSFSDKALSYKIIRTFGIGESKLETVLLPLIDAQTDPTIATYAKEGESSLRIASQRPTKEEADQAVDDMLEQVREIIGEFIYSTSDEELHEVVGRALIEKNISISSCESCTGGMFAAKLVDVPGISAVFDRGIVTYSNRSKIEELGVSEDVLNKFGPESPEVAAEMALGLARITGSRLCISSTGVAGPGSNVWRGLIDSNSKFDYKTNNPADYSKNDPDNNPDNNELNAADPIIVPAGDMFIGVYFDGKVHVKEMHTGRDDRGVNRNSCMLTMFNEIRKVIGESE